MLKSILIGLFLATVFSGCQFQNQDLDVPKTKTKIFDKDNWQPINKNSEVLKNG